jgi:hypothetical protein
MLISFHLTVCRDNAFRAVGTNHTVLEIEGPSIAKGLRHDHLDPLSIRWMHALDIGVIARAELPRLKAIDRIQLGRPGDAVIEDVPFPASFRRRATPDWFL